MIRKINDGNSLYHGLISEKNWNGTKLEIKMANGHLETITQNKNKFDGWRCERGRWPMEQWG